MIQRILNKVLEKGRQYHLDCGWFHYWFCDDWGFIRFYKVSTWKRPNGISIRCLKAWFRIDYEYGKIKFIKEVS